MAVVKDWAKNEIRRAASDPAGKNSCLTFCPRTSQYTGRAKRRPGRRATDLVALRDEEHRRAEGALAVLLGRDLVVQQPLDVIDREQVLAVHRDDDGVPDLRDEDFRLVLDLHVVRREDLGVDALRQTLKDVCSRYARVSEIAREGPDERLTLPRGPDGETDRERARDRVDCHERPPVNVAVSQLHKSV